MNGVIEVQQDAKIQYLESHCTAAALNCIKQIRSWVVNLKVNDCILVVLLQCT
jgi:hypothetical protein